MAQKIRVGVIGARVGTNWAARAHLPALAASPDCELTAVCTTKPESAEESRQKFGARLAFHDYHQMIASPDIDVVAVVVRVPSHYEPTKAAIAAGKHVYTEWPLGRTTQEALELTALARSKGVHTIVGLQARVNPGLVYMKELIASGHIGDVLTCHISLIRGEPVDRPAARTWQKDASMGANTLTIAAGHTLDALRFVMASDFSRISSVVATQVKQWLNTDTKQTVDVTAPDNVMVNAHLANGAVVAAHIAAAPWAGSGYRMEVYGSKGTLVVRSEESPQLREVTLYGAQGGHALQPMEIPARLIFVPDSMPKGSPYVVGQMYYEVAQALRTGKSNHPTFDTAVELHHILDALRLSSDTGKEVLM